MSEATPAEDAVSLVVVNHHLLCADLAVKDPAAFTALVEAVDLTEEEEARFDALMKDK